MRASAELDTRSFNAFVRELANMGVAPFEDVLKGEVGKTLSLCVKYTGSAKAKAYPRRHKTTSGGNGFAKENDAEVWVNTIGKGNSPIGRAWLRMPNAQGKPTNYILRGPGSLRRWSDERWKLGERLLKAADIDPSEKARAKRKKDKITGRGLAKRSWVQIGEDLGIKVQAPAYVMKAIPQDGKPRKSGTARKFKTTRSMFIEISNRYPILVGRYAKLGASFDGVKILQRAMKTRETAFAGDLRRGVLRNLKLRAQRYPGVFVSP